MGVYLSKACKHIDNEQGQGSDLQFCLAECQGWRKNMEDAHIADAALHTNAGLDTVLGNKATSIFGVFDGHGGKEVAKFTQDHFIQEFTNNKYFQAKDFQNALKYTFHRIDELLEDAKTEEMLEKYRKIPNPSDIYGEKPADDGVRVEKKGLSLNGIPLDKALEQFVLKNLFGKEPEPDEEGDDDEAGDEVAVSDEKNIYDGKIDDKDESSDTKSESKVIEFKDAKMDDDKVSGVVAEKKSENALVESVEKLSITSESSTDRGNLLTYTPQENKCNLSDHRVNAGCTAVVAFKHGNELYVANAGDSRGCLCRGDGSAFPLSEDHKPQQSREFTRIANAGGFVTGAGRINGNLNLSRALGDLKYKQTKNIPKEDQIITAEPDITVTTLLPDDRFFVLACDGVWDCLTCDEICAFISSRLDSGNSINDIVNDVINHCIADNPRNTGGIGGDNLTCLIVLLKQ